MRPVIAVLAGLPVALLLAAIAALFAVDHIVPKEALREAMAATLRDATGLNVHIAAIDRISALPIAAIEISGLRIDDPSSATGLETNKAEATLALSDLLWGNVRVKTLRIEQATLDLPSAGGGHAFENLGSALLRLPDRARIRLNDFRVRSPAVGPDLHLSSVQIVTSGPDETVLISVAGLQPDRLTTTFDLRLDNRAALSSGAATDLSVSIEDAAGKASLRGSIGRQAPNFIEGELRIDAADLSDLPFAEHLPDLNTAVLARALQALPSDSDLTATLKITDRSMTLENAELDLGDLDIAGDAWLEFRPGKTSILRANLAGNKLILDGDQSSQDFAVWLMQPLDKISKIPFGTDIRLSFGSVRASGIEAGPVALSLIGSDDLWRADVSQTGFFGGNATAELVLNGEEAPSTRLLFNANGVDLKRIADRISETAGLRIDASGRADVSLKLSAQSGRLAALALAGSGEFVLETRGGLLGIDQLMETAAAADIEPEIRQKLPSAFERTRLTATIAGLSPIEIHFEGEDKSMKLTAAGTLTPLPKPSVLLKAMLRPIAETGGADAPGVDSAAEQLEFMLDGPLATRPNPTR